MTNRQRAGALGRYCRSGLKQMNPWNLAIAWGPGQESEAEAIRMKLAEAWTDTPTANLSTVRLGELNPDYIRSRARSSVRLPIRRSLIVVGAASGRSS